jgi:hypothetical protein
MKTIGFDLDETLIELSALIKKVFKDFDCLYEPPEDWTMSNYPNKVKKEIFRRFKDNRYMCNLKPFKQSRPTLKALKKLGYKLIIITARDKSLNTIDYVNSLFNVDKVFVVGLDQSKKELIKKEKIDLWVDDAPHQIEELKKDIPCLLIRNKHTKYNYYINDCPIIKNVGEIFKYL